MARQASGKGSRGRTSSVRKRPQAGWLASDVNVGSTMGGGGCEPREDDGRRAEEVHAASATGEYVSVEIDNDVDTDENAIVYVVEGDGRFSRADITPESEIA